MITPSHAFLAPPPPSMRKTYLSMSMSRAWGAEMPVGDPFGGPAYGEKNAPVIAVVAAVASISAGAAAVAAGSMLVGGAMIAGGVLSIAGTVSGNSKLSKIGGLLSLAGGIGGYMTDAWATTASSVAEGSQLAGGAAEGASAAAAPAEALAYTPQADYQNLISQGVGADQAAMMTGYTPGGAEMAGAQVGGPMSASVPSGVNLPPLDQSAMANAGMGGPVPPGGPAAAPADMGFGSAAPNLGAPAMPAPGGDGLISGAMPPQAPAAAGPAAGPNIDSAFSARTATGLPAVPGDAGATAPGFFDSLKAGNYMDAAKAAGSGVMDLAKSNPGAALMLGNAAGGVADALSGKTGAQIDQAEAAAAYYNAKAEEAKRELEEKEARRRRLNEGFMTVDARLPGNLSSNILTMNQPQGQSGNVITPQFTMIPTQGLITNARRPTRPGSI